MAQVVDPPFEHRDALETHSEGEAGVFLRIYTRCFEHVRVDHSTAENLKPARSLADVAALSVADVAAYVNLCGRFCEREVGRTHPDLGFRSEHLACEQKYRLLEVGEGYVLIDVETFHLMENAVCTRADGLVSENPARADDPDREGHLLH